jgi:CXXX repeat peptide maturase
MLKYLMIMIGESSVPFCYYENKTGNKNTVKLISYENLKKAVIFALKNNLKVNFLYPDIKLEKKYDRLIDEVEHIKIIPVKLHKTYKDSILVIESDDLSSDSLLKNLKDENIIFRLRYEQLNKLYSYLNKLIPKCRRINLVLLDIERYGEKDFDEYRHQLEKISKKIFKLKDKKNLPEMNFLTDRLTLEQMNNCDAGLNHLTVTPNGKLYLCPAFYHNDENDTLGEISNDIKIKNKQLLELKYSPICRICDAYQCKRCVFLNKKLTAEINTPSSQQCRLSHIEREASRLFLQKLKETSVSITGFKDIPEIDYNDPYENAKKNKFTISEFKNL